MDEKKDDKTFDPDEHKAAEVIDELKDAPEVEKNRIATEELAGQARKSVLKAAGVDPSERRDASGRTLFPWETTPKPVDA